MGAAAAIAAAAWLLPRPDAEGDAAAGRWRARAMEAEREIAALRARVARLEAQRAAPPVPAKAPPTPATAPPAIGPTHPDPPAPAPPEHEWPELGPAWDALVGGALQDGARRHGRELTPEQEARLLDRLRAVRDAAIDLEGDPGEDELAAQRGRLSRAILLLEADRAFRDEVGVGAAEFLGELDGDQVIDVLPPGPAEAIPEARGAPDTFDADS